MLGSISPVGETSRRQRWWLTATAYTVGSVTGGATTGAVLGLLGAAAFALFATPATARLIVLAVVVAAGAAVDAGVVRVTLPSWRRQVDERWLTTYRGWVYGLGFGAQLGSAVATIIPAAITYGMLAACLLTGSIVRGALIGVAYGVVRSVPLLLTARLRTPADLYAVTQRVAAAERAAQRLAVAGQVGVVAVALTVGVTRL